MRFKALVSVAFLVAVLAAFGCSEKEETAGKGDMQEVTGDVAITVDGSAITADELAGEVSRLKSQYEQRLGAQQVDAMKSAIKTQSVTNVINRRLLEAAARERGFVASDEKVEQRIADLRAQYPSPEAFDERLAAGGMTMEQLRGEMKSGIGIEEMLEAELEKAPKKTDEELLAFYEENVDRFKEAEQVRASHILVKVEPSDTDAMKAEKLLKIKNIREELLLGADFAEKAREASECPSSANGGDLGFFEHGSMVKPFADAAFALDVGSISPIVETQFGFHVIKVTERKPARTVPFDEARQHIEADFERSRQQEVVGRLLNELREKAQIVYVDSVWAI
ncbi:MAG: peptidylprolyl isomerase [Candidatus Krumholzibacteriota bacterium]|nr:peptidylprolyl isomerase [Candidatus Krumholzibacteriota bacterium]